MSRPIPFRVVWRRVGGDKTFSQLVLASSMREALAVARLEARRALGENLKLWEFECVVGYVPSD